MCSQKYEVTRVEKYVVANDKNTANDDYDEGAPVPLRTEGRRTMASARRTGLDTYLLRPLFLVINLFNSSLQRMLPRILFYDRQPQALKINEVLNASDDLLSSPIGT